MWPKVLAHVKKKSLYNQPKPYFFSKNYCEVISGKILTNLHQNIWNCLYFDCLFAHYVYMNGFYLYII